jgi:hypothetical protein
MLEMLLHDELYDESKLYVVNILKSNSQKNYFNITSLADKIAIKFVETKKIKNAIKMANSFKIIYVREFILSTIALKINEIGVISGNSNYSSEAYNILKSLANPDSLKEFMQQTLSEEEQYLYWKKITPKSDEDTRGYFYNKTLSLIQIAEKYRLKNDMKKAKIMIDEAHIDFEKGDGCFYGSNLNKDIAIEYAKQKYFDISIRIANEFSDFSEKINTYCQIFSEMYISNLNYELVNLEEKILKMIFEELDQNFENNFNNGLIFLANSYFEQNKYDKGFSIIQQINLINYKHSAIEDLSRIFFSKNGLISWEKYKLNFSNSEEIFFWNKALVKEINCINIQDFDLFFLLKISLLNEQILKHILYCYAINQIFFKKKNTFKLEKNNQVLDLLWAIDIKKELD